MGGETLFRRLIQVLFFFSSVGATHMNVPVNLVRNPQRQSAIQEFKARVKDETPESPTRWLPTPPTTS